MSDIPLFQGLPSDTMMALRACLKNRELKVGDKAFSAGDGSDELYIIRKGEVRIMFPIAGREPFYVASFGAGDFFGDMSFLDHNRRSADAIAREDCAIWVLSRTDLEKLIQSMPSVGAMVFERMARVLAIRLRHADAELRALADA
jgi:SulP family sulfate permease